jgi:hypothetical protein
MENPKVPLKSGKELELQSPSFGEATRLYKALCAELIKVDVSLKLSDFKSLGSRDVGALKNVILQVVGSDSIESAIFACAARSTINGERITRATFEPAEARRDWLPVALEVAKHSLAPFFADLDFGSSEKVQSSTPPSPV